MLILAPDVALAQTDNPFSTPTSTPSDTSTTIEFSITLDNIQPSEECTPYGWTIIYDRTTLSPFDPYSTSRSYIQYVNGDLTTVNRVDEHSTYVQDAWVSHGTLTSVRAAGNYSIPLWTDTYQAESIEYIWHEDDLVWQIQATLTCEAGEITEYTLTSEPVPANHDPLPDPESVHNLVVATEAISVYGNPYQKKDSFGTIETCQTFFIGNPWTPRASITTWIHESVTDHDLPFFDGSTRLPIIDVADDYGQPLLEQCGGESATTPELTPAEEVAPDEDVPASTSTPVG
ncbi:MAG TPA: hypothetical protein VHL11_09960 [Phototrophicaceae bacterium]|nr:hypothetical protein [Phototrophicaceae bacterium]